MPLSVVQRLNLGELTPTAITLQMDDRSMAQPEGILEDVLVKVGKFIFPVDFVIMKMEKDTQIPMLLGRPFLPTGAAITRIIFFIFSFIFWFESVNYAETSRAGFLVILFFLSITA